VPTGCLQFAHPSLFVLILNIEILKPCIKLLRRAA
jgi:hypothetical protein